MLDQEAMTPEDFLKSKLPYADPTLVAMFKVNVKSSLATISGNNTYSIDDLFCAWKHIVHEQKLYLIVDAEGRGFSKHKRGKAPSAEEWADNKGKKFCVACMRRTYPIKKDFNDHFLFFIFSIMTFGIAILFWIPYILTNKCSQCGNEY